MPDTPPTKFTVEAVDWSDIGYQLAHGLLKLLGEVKAGDGMVALLGKKEGAVQALAFEWIVELAIKLGEGLHKLEAPFFPVIAGFVAPIVQGLFGANVNEAQFAHRLAKGGGHEAARAIVDGFLKAIEGDGVGDLKPGPDGSARVASAAVAASLESTFNAIVPELLSDLVPFEIGHFKELTELPEGIIRALGVGRLVRRAVGPLVNVCAATPMEWHVNKKYRPTLLSAGAAVRQTLRGKWPRNKTDEELARQGYSPDRIEALFNAEQKFLGPSDVRMFISRDEWTQGKGLQHLKDQGYDETTASDALRLDGLRRFDELEGQEANLIIGAYANRDIDKPDFDRALANHVSVAAERALYTELGALRRALNIRRLSLAQLETMVRSGVANTSDYRAAAERDGYPSEDVSLLELQLRWELNKEKAVADHRAEMEAAHAAAAAERAAALAARKAEIEQQRAIARRGPEADLERAAIRGKIPIDRVAEVYAAHYDDDAVQLLVGLLEDDRQAYLDQQQRTEDARKRGAQRNLDAGALEQAFARNLLTAGELRDRLVAIGFAGADADLLVATAVDKKSDADAAAKKKADADAAAKKQGIDLGRYERLVRKGARTIVQYRTLLEQLGVDEAAIPDFVDALQLLIDEDAAAQAAREHAAAAPPPKGLSLEQIRRAVVLGVTTEDQFQSYLVQNRYTSDAQLVLLAELRADVADAELARRRREIAAPEPATPGSPLSTIRRAAQLGIVPPNAYLDRLRDAGYSDDDLDIELELLLTEIADVQAARRKRDEPAPATAPPGPSLADLERAVKLGVASLGQYRARAVELGKSPEEIDLLAAVVERELQSLAAARKAHDDLGLRLAAAGDDLKALDAGVKDGTLEIVDYIAELEARGVASDEAQLVAAYVAFTLGG